MSATTWTKEEFRDRFEAAFRDLCDRYCLTPGWRLYFKYPEKPLDCYAQVETCTADRVIRVELCPEAYKSLPDDLESPEAVALHEFLHTLLDDLIMAVQAQPKGGAMVDGVEHHLINRIVANCVKGGILTF